jgi:DNA-binding GntR family transcriptional regulator
VLKGSEKPSLPPGLLNVNTDIQNLFAVKNHSLGDVVQQLIEDWIFSGELSGGDRINEKQLSEQLGVSRAPIREATRGLQQLGLVEVIINRGAFVRSVNVKRVVEIFNIRACLARLAASEAVARITNAGLAKLEELIEQMQNPSSPEEYLRLNFAFHDQIFQISDNERLASLEIGLGKELRLFRLRGLRSGGGLNVSNTEHREIFSALQNRDPKQAAHLFELHVLAGRDRFLSTISGIERQQPKQRRARGQLMTAGAVAKARR